MTVVQWTDILRDRIIRINKALQLDKREVKKAMSLAFNQLLSESPNKTELYNTYSREYTDVEVVLDAITLRYYSEYPVSVLFYGDDLQKSVRNINDDAGESLDYVPIKEEEYYLWEGQAVFLIDDSVYYYIQKDKIVFLTGVDEDSEILTNGIRMKLLTSLEDYADSDEVQVPDNKEREFGIYVLEFLGITPPTNLKDNI